MSRYKKDNIVSLQAYGAIPFFLKRHTKQLRSLANQRGEKISPPTKKQHKKGRYVFVMSRTSLIVLLAFLLLLSIICFMSGFLISKSIHEKHPQPAPSPIVVHTVPPTEAAHHGEAKDKAPHVNRSDGTKLGVQGEVAAFMAQNEGEKTAKNVNKEDTSVKKSDDHPHAKDSHHILPHKAGKEMSAAQKHFHHLVGVDHTGKKANHPTHDQHPKKADSKETHPGAPSSHGGSPHAATSHSVHHETTTEPSTHASQPVSQSSNVKVRTVRQHKAVAAEGPATHHHTSHTASSHGPAWRIHHEHSPQNKKGRWPQKKNTAGMIVLDNNAPDGGRTDLAKYDLNSYGPAHKNLPEEQKKVFFENRHQTYASLQGEKHYKNPTFKQVEDYESAAGEEDRFVNAGEKYAVQIGAHPDVKSAHHQRQRYLQEGYGVHIYKAHDKTGKQWYLVRTGSYHSLEVANEYAHEFRNKEGTQAVVVEVRPTEKKII